MCAVGASVGVMGVEPSQYPVLTYEALVLPDTSNVTVLADALSVLTLIWMPSLSPGCIVVTFLRA